MRPFLITARTPTFCITFSARARSSSEVAMLTAALFGDTPFGITVTCQG